MFYNAQWWFSLSTKPQAKEVKKADKLLSELEVLVNPTKTPKPKLAEIEAVWSICRKLTGVTD